MDIVYKGYDPDRTMTLEEFADAEGLGPLIVTAEWEGDQKRWIAGISGTWFLDYSNGLALTQCESMSGATAGQAVERYCQRIEGMELRVGKIGAIDCRTVKVPMLKPIRSWYYGGGTWVNVYVEGIPGLPDPPVIVPPVPPPRRSWWRFWK